MPVLAPGLVMVVAVEKRTRSETTTALWATPAYRQLVTRRLRETGGTPEKRRKLSIFLTGIKRSFRAKTKAHAKKIGDALRGKPKSEAHREKLRKPKSEEHRANMRHPKSAAHTEKMAVNAARQLARWPKPRTVLELALYRLLRGAGLAFVAEKRFGRYIADAYVAELDVIFEADGSFWHKDVARTRRRDAYLVNRVTAIIHLTDGDLLPWVE